MMGVCTAGRGAMSESDLGIPEPDLILAEVINNAYSGSKRVAKAVAHEGLVVLARKGWWTFWPNEDALARCEEALEPDESIGIQYFVPGTKHD